MSPPIKYTKHAKYRMKIREEGEWMVEETIFNPDKTYIGSNGEINALKQFGKRNLRVIYLSLPEEIRILTVIE